MAQTETCLKITVETSEVVQTDDTLALVLSVVFGLIGGIVVGLLVLICVYKLSGKTIGSKAHTGTSNNGFIEDVKLKPQQTIETSTETQKQYSHKPKHKSDAKVSVSGEASHATAEFVGLEDIVVDITWDAMISELGKQELCELMRMEHSLWEERHICLMQCYRILLNDLAERRQISESQHADILTKEDRHLSKSLHDFETTWKKEMISIADSKGQTLLDIFTPLQESYVKSLRNMVLEYHSSHMRFLRHITLLCNADDLEYTKERLQFHTDAVEGVLRENQDELNESIRQAFREFGVLVRELVIALLRESELNRIQTFTCNDALEKLVKAGRISSETKKKIKRLMDEDFNVTYEEIKMAFSDVHPQIIAHYKTSLEQHEHHTTELLHSILTSYANRTSTDGFLEHYIAACLDQKTQRLSMLRELAASEDAAISEKLHLISQRQSQKRQEQLNSYCELLTEHDALDAAEGQSMMVDFSAKMKNASSRITTTCKRNIDALWAIYERHCMQIRQQENAIGASVLQDIATDNILSLEGFIAQHGQLSDEDKESILHERERLFLLLVNLVNIHRTKWFHVFENDLAKCQAFLLMKKSEQLMGENLNEVLGIIERLWNERNAMRNYIREIASVSGIKAVLLISNNVMCQVIAQKLLSKSLQTEVAHQTEAYQLEFTKTNIIEKIAAKNGSNMAMMVRDHNNHLSQQMGDEMSRFEVATGMLMEDLSPVYSKRQGRLKIKYDRISQHIPPMGSTSEDIQPYLERLLLQHQVARAMELVEIEGHQQILTHRQNLTESCIDAITGLSRASEISLLMKLAALTGLKKSDITDCVQKGIADVSSDADGKVIMSKLLKHWKEAKLYADNAVA